MVDSIDIKRACVDAYKKHRHLKLAAEEVGIKWQTVYVYLKELGVSVTGDKSAYGSPKDKLAAMGEDIFKSLVPFAVNNNDKQFQPKIDFDVLGIPVDVKTAKPRLSSKRCKLRRWAFCIKKQAIEAEFFVCIGLPGFGVKRTIFLMPSDVIGYKQTISVPVSGNSKWFTFQVNEHDLAKFFKDMAKAKNAA